MYGAQYPYQKYLPNGSAAAAAGWNTPSSVSNPGTDKNSLGNVKRPLDTNVGTRPSYNYAQGFQQNFYVPTGSTPYYPTAPPNQMYNDQSEAAQNFRTQQPTSQYVQSSNSKPYRNPAARSPPPLRHLSQIPMPNVPNAFYPNPALRYQYQFATNPYNQYYTPNQAPSLAFNIPNLSQSNAQTYPNHYGHPSQM